MANYKHPEVNGNQDKPPAAVTIPLPPYVVTRNVLLQSNVNQLSAYEQRDKKLVTTLKKAWSKFNLLATILNLMPVLQWLPKYSLRTDLLNDMMSGTTVAVMHIPQGMAYGLLAGGTPSTGLYMAFFPTLVYFAFGTSKHISVGTLSIISVMTLKLVATYAIQPSEALRLAVNSTATTLLESNEPEVVFYTAQQVITATAFVCGLQHLIMFTFRLGNLSSLLSESLVNGFTTGAAMHVLSSQLKELFGVKIPRHVGYLQIVYTVIDWSKQLINSNINTIIISLSVIAFMVAMNEVVKPKASKLCRFPIPAELIAVLGGTLASYLLGFETNYNVQSIGHIPLGFPLPQMPPVKLLSLVAVDSIAIAIVSYSVTISMGMILAKKQNYEVRPNQELLALGLSNLVGGVFSCIPNATSLSRSLIQEQTGGKSQISSVISAFLIMCIILWIGPIFEVLPRCVLSGIIVVALKGMYMQAADLKRFHREGSLESLTWIATFAAVVLVDVDIGLIFGIFVSLVAVYIKGWKSTYALLGRVPGTDIYVDVHTHRLAERIDGVHIFRYSGAINFASRSNFKRALYKAIHIDCTIIRKASMKDANNVDGTEKRLLPTPMRTLIVDLSCVSHMDVAAFKTCQDIQKEMLLLNTRTILTCPNDRVLDAVQHAEWLGIATFMVMPSVHDAVTYALAQPTVRTESD